MTSLESFGMPIKNPMNVEEKLRHHPDDRKTRWRPMFVPKAVEKQKAKESQENLEKAYERHEIAKLANSLLLM
ncbi:hypothetical protein V6N13_013767 [Hibiscus sabdariffa]